jgi:sugar (pentulose or hexulose) kinase
MGKTDQFILTMDFGTQSVRVGIFDKNGNVLAMEKQKYEPAYFSKLPNFAEQDPNYYFDCLCQCTKRLSEARPDLLSSVVGITLTCFRDSAVLLDKEMKVIRPMILWLDQRTAECPKKLPAYQRAIFRLIGKSDTINFNRKRSVGNWIAENEPENWAKVYKFINVSTYFIYLLTGELKDSSSDQSGHYPISDKKRQWLKNPEKDITGQIFNLKGSMLCTLVPEGGLMGRITKEAAQKTGLKEGLPMYACGSDKSCETFRLRGH